MQGTKTHAEAKKVRVRSFPFAHVTAGKNVTRSALPPPPSFACAQERFEEGSLGAIGVGTTPRAIGLVPGPSWVKAESSAWCRRDCGRPGRGVSRDSATTAGAAAAADEVVAGVDGLGGGGAGDSECRGGGGGGGVSLRSGARRTGGAAVGGTSWAEGAPVETGGFAEGASAERRSFPVGDGPGRGASAVWGVVSTLGG